MISWFGAVFCVGRSATGAVAADALPAIDNRPAAPSSGIVFALLFRFGLCFAFDIVMFLPNYGRYAIVKQS